MIQIINGLVYGSFLYLLSVGLVLIFGLRRVTNFAHGGLFMLGAYLAYAVSGHLGFWVGMVVSVIGLAILGVLLDRLVFRPLANENEIVTLLVTFGLLFVIEDPGEIVEMAPPGDFFGGAKSARTKAFLQQIISH